MNRSATYRYSNSLLFVTVRKHVSVIKEWHLFSVSSAYVSYQQKKQAPQGLMKESMLVCDTIVVS